ncbi:hypothetical protein LINPERHAP2_LOCUS13917 [Linum perenne]
MTNGSLEDWFGFITPVEASASSNGLTLPAKWILLSIRSEISHAGMGLSLTMVQVSVHQRISGEEPEHHQGSSAPRLYALETALRPTQAIEQLEDTVEFFSSRKNIKSVSTMLITSSPKPWLTWKKSSRFFVVQFQDLVVDLVHSIVEIVTCSDRQDMQIFEYAFPLKL